MLWGSLFIHLATALWGSVRETVSKTGGPATREEKGLGATLLGRTFSSEGPQFGLNRSARVLVGCNSQREAERGEKGVPLQSPGSSEEEQRGR